VTLPPAPTVARNALGSKTALGTFAITYARLVLLDWLRHRLRSHTLIPLVSCFAQTPAQPLLSVRCAQETPPCARSGPREIPAPLIGNRLVARFSARPDAWFVLPPLSDQASQSSSTQGARYGSFSGSRHRHSRENEKYWNSDRAPQEAREKAHECKMAGDIEGLHAWGKVAKVRK
jgi:hypothetical protein